ncbi:uncharacterized protein LOC130676050 [Microplitis mediator]|uniref:uncharacterized protein LOC130676050 n=1 Tax=Microplitis mediator TaxID=375433 RepID=UPI0025563F26|nr:uncharacterized protein LOC130676050 [Microplitis mediator]
MSFNQLSDQIKKRVFSNLEPEELLRLRRMDSSWKIIIDDLKIWKKVCSIGEIKPWKSQLIKLRYPSLNSDKYNDLKDKQWKIIFLLYKKWRQVFRVNKYEIVKFGVPQENIPHELVEASDVKFSYDLLADHFAMGMNCVGINCLFQRLGFTHTFKFEENADTDIRLDDDEINSHGFNYFIEIKIWMTGTGKVIYVMYFRNQILFWDVMRKTKIPTPRIFFQDIRKSLHLRRGTDEYFYIINTWGESLNVLRLEYVENEITTREILIINYRDNDFFEFIDFYAEERKIMIIHKTRNIENTLLLTTIVEISESQLLPVNISAYDTHTAASKVINEIQEYKFIIPCMNVVIAHATDNTRKFIVQISRFDERNKHIAKLKHYKIPRSIISHNFEITSIALYYNHLFVATSANKLIIFKLKNLQHLSYLNFNYIKKRIMTIETTTNGFQITKHKNIIVILLASSSSQVSFLLCDLPF